MQATRTSRFAAFVSLMVLAACPLIALGQSRQIPAPAQTRPVLIHSATIHTVTNGVVSDGYVLLESGRITQIGQGRPNLQGAEVHDASGLHVYPGLIGADTTLGLTEVGAVDVTLDHTELGRIKPEVRAAVAVNPDSDLIPVARANGILTAGVLPKGGLISGQAAVLSLDGWTWEDMALVPSAGLVVNWPRTEPINAWWEQRSEEEQRKQIKEDLENVERIFDDAKAYLAAKDNDPTFKTDLRFEAMRGAVQGRQKVFVRASSMSQIESAVSWAARRGLSIVIVGAHQADRVIPLLLDQKIQVIIGGLHRLPSRRHSAYDELFRLPSRLHEAGVDFCIASGTGSAHERNLNHIAATSAAYGLPREVALQSVTIAAARALGLGDSLGSLEEGKRATLIVTNGDPLEITTDTLLAFIDGRRIDLGSRHKALYEKYRQKYVQLGLIEE